ncbi:hypothetical protein ScPMuIL_015668 [Solemya velum]
MRYESGYQGVNMAAVVESVVRLPELRGFVVRCMQAVGATKEHAEPLADLLVSADYRGHYSHGLNRLDMYMKELESGIAVSGDVEPTVVKQTAATALVDGHNVLGPVVGKFCIDLAIAKARTAGIGWVSAKGSNHFGIAGWYSIRASEQGLIGMAFTNTSPLMVPTRAKEVTLGTNPISVAAPANGDSFVLDMATTAVALGKVEIQERKGEEIPLGWAVDKTGTATPNPSAATGLLPLGGTEHTSGYKGYGLGMMVEMFCGIMSGGAYGPHVRKWKTCDKIANLGQCFVAIDPNAFEDGFKDRMTDLIDICRGLQPADGEEEVLIPGDPERKHMQKCDHLGGIPYHPNQIKYANDIAAKYQLDPMEQLK